MKIKLTITLSGIMLAALAACDFSPSLGEAVSDVQEAAPSVCKNICEESVDCSWEDRGGDKENEAFDLAVRSCVNSCAFTIKKGGFFYEIDDGEWEFKEKISGSKYKSYLNCLKDVYSCDDNVYGYDLADEDDCEDYCDCLDELDVDYSCEWNDFCEFEEDTGIFFG